MVNLGPRGPELAGMVPGATTLVAPGTIPVRLFQEGGATVFPRKKRYRKLARNCKIGLCNEMGSPDFRTLERQLTAEIAAKDRAIGLLEQEREALRRVLYAARKRELGAQEVTRSNSLSRVMAEGAILDRLRQSRPAPVSVTQLQIVAGGAVYGLSESTFRSHLHRLKARGLIESPRRGWWRIKPEQPSSAAGLPPSDASSI